MGSSTTGTFNALKHYVSVRLQQGVPLLDADWNEMDDIRRFELRAFLKWFVGDGVPAGNDGFHILPATRMAGNVMLAQGSRLNATTVAVDQGQSTAAAALGFGPDNATAVGLGRAARLQGTIGEPFQLWDGMTLSVDVLIDKLSGGPGEGGHGLPGLEGELEAPGRSEPDLPGPGGRRFTVAVTFQRRDFADIGAATLAEVVKVINAAHGGLAAPGSGAGFENDFVIQNGDGAAQIGYCLVDGQEATGEGNLCYSGQRLYKNAGLARAWSAGGPEVAPLPALSEPAGKDRADLVYLDVWERLVDDAEDGAIKNAAIGMATCTRIRREWAVRVAVDVAAAATAVPEGLKRARHSYYPLARLQRKAGQKAIGAGEIVDLRRTGLGVLSDVLTIKDGKVGIGTADPHERLVIQGSLGEEDVSLLFRTQDGASPAEFFDAIRLRAGWHGTAKPDWKAQRLSVQGKLSRNLDDWLEIMTLKADGNVGIGTTEPKARLDIRDASMSSIVQIRSSIPALVRGYENGGAIYFGVDSTAGADEPTAAIETSWGESGEWNPQIAIGVTRRYKEAGRANVLMDYGGNTSIRQGTASRLYVQGNTGYVGMGTVAPTCALQIEGDTSGELNLLVQNKCHDGARTYLTAMAGKSLIQTDKDFAIATNGGGWSDKLLVKNNGDVVIGSPTRSPTLDIRGSLHIGGDIDFDDNPFHLFTLEVPSFPYKLTGWSTLEWQAIIGGFHCKPPVVINALYMDKNHADENDKAWYINGSTTTGMKSCAVTLLFIRKSWVN